MPRPMPRPAPVTRAMGGSAGTRRTLAQARRRVKPWPPPRRLESRAMTKWEYATVPVLVHATKQILDNGGEDGWELVQVVPGPGGGEQVVAYLKREKS